MKEYTIVAHEGKLESDYQTEDPIIREIIMEALFAIMAELEVDDSIESFGEPVELKFKIKRIEAEVLGEHDEFELAFNQILVNEEMGTELIDAIVNTAHKHSVVGSLEFLFRNPKLFS